MTEPTLAEFLLARIAEDAETVRGLTHPWEAHYEDTHNRLEMTHDGLMIAHERIRAECEAKRRIVELHWNTDPSCARCVNPDDEMTNEPWPCSTLRLLARPYADHPDYRDEWRP